MSNVEITSWEHGVATHELAQLDGCHRGLAEGQMSGRRRARESALRLR